MIKVLKHGTRKAICRICKAELEYEVEDVKEGRYYDDITDQHSAYLYIECPDCKSKVFI